MNLLPVTKTLQDKNLASEYLSENYLQLTKNSNLLDILLER